MSTLRDVLNLVERSQGSLALPQMAAELQLDQTTLENMLEFWVRKGKLRAVYGSGVSCDQCGFHNGCPFTVSLPKRYELVQPGDSLEAAVCFQIGEELPVLNFRHD